MSKWQVEDVGNQPDQQRYPLPNREHVPMAEREARASRFVSLLVGHTEKQEPSLSSSKVLRLQQEVEAQFLPGALDSGVSQQQAEVGHSVPLNVRTSQ